MFLQEISSTEAQRQMGELFKLGNKKPTLLTRMVSHGKPKADLVVMSKKHYAKLLKDSNKD
tara:strand:+ start:470 stop:652 length:183 start_codon:yes stop_codon:yes gene_type:complete